MQHCVFSHVFARKRTFGLAGYTLFALIPIRRLIHRGCVFLLYTGAQTGYAEYACELGYAVHSVLRIALPCSKQQRASSPSPMQTRTCARTHSPVTGLCLGSSQGASSSRPFTGVAAWVAPNTRVLPAPPCNRPPQHPRHDPPLAAFQGQPSPRSPLFFGLLWSRPVRGWRGAKMRGSVVLNVHTAPTSVPLISLSPPTRPYTSLMFPPPLSVPAPPPSARPPAHG